MSGELKELDIHSKFMKIAYDFAVVANNDNEVPVGAIIVFNNKIIGSGYNQKEKLQDPLAHAEIIAIKEASKNLNSWRLLDTTLYVTLEPCVMCAGAIINSRISTIVYGCLDPKAGAIESIYKIGQDRRLNHRCNIIGNVMEFQCKKLITDFFKKKRCKLC